MGSNNYLLTGFTAIQLAHFWNNEKILFKPLQGEKSWVRTDLHEANVCWPEKCYLQKKLKKATEP